MYLFRQKTYSMDAKQLDNLMNENYDDLLAYVTYLFILGFYIPNAMKLMEKNPC